MAFGGSRGIRAPDLPRMKRLHWTNYAMLPRIFAHSATAFSGRWLCGCGSGLGGQDLGRDSDGADDDEDDVFHSIVFYDILTGFACTFSNIDITGTR